MADASQLSDRALVAINDAGIAVASVSLAVGGLILIIIAIQYYRFPQCVRKICSNGPTLLLGASLAASIPFSICWIISCSEASHNQAICKSAMWGIIFFLNMIAGSLGLMLVQCALLLSRWGKFATRRYMLLWFGLVVLISFALSLVGIIMNRFGYLEEQDTCWVVTHKRYSNQVDEMRANYAMLSIILYGPLWGSLILDAGLFAYVIFRLNYVWDARRGIDRRSRESVSKAITRRVAFIPLGISMHTLLVIGGDLPIEYSTKAGRFVSYLCNYIGFSSFTIFVAICAVFIDPSFLRICRLKRSTVDEPSTCVNAHPMKQDEESCAASVHVTDGKTDSDNSPFAYELQLQLPQTPFEFTQSQVAIPQPKRVHNSPQAPPLLHRPSSMKAAFLRVENSTGASEYGCSLRSLTPSPRPASLPELLPLGRQVFIMVGGDEQPVMPDSAGVPLPGGPILPSPTRRAFLAEQSPTDRSFDSTPSPQRLSS